MSRTQTTAAIAATMTYAALRNASDPAKLSKAVRTARAGYALGLVTLDDLTAEEISAPIRVVLPEAAA